MRGSFGPCKPCVNFVTSSAQVVTVTFKGHNVLKQEMYAGFLGIFFENLKTFIIQKRTKVTKFALTGRK